VRDGRRADGDRGETGLHVFVIPSWVGGVSAPLSGIFILEQAQALARLHPAWTVTLSAVNHHVLTTRLITIGKLVRGVSQRPWRAGGTEPAGFVHPKRHLFLRRQTLLSGDVRPFVVAHRRLFEAAARREMPAILHAHVAWPAGAVARELSREFGIPYIVTEHMSPFPLPAPPFADGAGRATLTVLEPLEAADAVVAVSRHLAAEMRVEGLHRPVEIIPNLVDTTMFHPGLRAPGDRPFVFLTVSRLTEDKGIGDLLLAVAEFRRTGRDARFRIAGTGPVGRYRTLAKRLGVADIVSFLGPMGRSEIAEEFRSAQALVMPARHESFGVVAIEAMASGIPVLATRSGGPESVLTVETGLLVPAAAPAELAHGMAAMMARYDGFDRSAIVGHCRRHYGAEIVAGRIAALYREVLGREAGPA
jgi:glycosyltransferase involved in cell wall biosynthesis